MVQTQEREAKENMKRKAKELQRQRQDAMKYGRNTSGYTDISGGGGGNGGRQDAQIVDSVPVDNPKPSYTSTAPSRLLAIINMGDVFTRDVTNAVSSSMPLISEQFYFHLDQIAVIISKIVCT